MLSVSEFAIALQYAYEDEMDNTATDEELEKLVDKILKNTFLSINEKERKQIIDEVIKLFKPL